MLVRWRETGSLKDESTLKASLQREEGEEEGGSLQYWWSRSLYESTPSHLLLQYRDAG